MELFEIYKNVDKYLDKEVVLSGWIRNHRRQKDFGFIDFADYPLKVLGAFGGVTAAGSALYLVFEIIKTLVMGKDTPGYASTICLILFFGGVIIAMLGLLGEYIGRMYLETKGRPVYVEKESNIDD